MNSVRVGQCNHCGCTLISGPDLTLDIQDVNFQTIENLTGIGTYVERFATRKCAFCEAAWIQDDDVKVDTTRSDWLEQLQARLPACWDARRELPVAGVGPNTYKVVKFSELGRKTVRQEMTPEEREVEFQRRCFEEAENFFYVPGVGEQF